MAFVQTVLGPIDAAELGPTLMHEHILFSYPGDELDPTGTWTRAEALAVATERMEQLKEHGVKTFVDPCAIEMGRDPELMAEVSQRTGMQIVCATGFYKEEAGLPYYWRVRSAEEVAELYLLEIEKGIGSTGIRPSTSGRLWRPRPWRRASRGCRSSPTVRTRSEPRSSRICSRRTAPTSRAP